jgi:xanthine/CO dehydrogenase XdhC/CoxF family maturation factor
MSRTNGGGLATGSTSANHRSRRSSLLGDELTRHQAALLCQVKSLTAAAKSLKTVGDFEAKYGPQAKEALNDRIPDVEALKTALKAVGPDRARISVGMLH